MTFHLKNFYLKKFNFFWKFYIFYILERGKEKKLILFLMTLKINYLENQYPRFKKMIVNLKKFLYYRFYTIFLDAIYKNYNIYIK